MRVGTTISGKISFRNFNHIYGSKDDVVGLKEGDRIIEVNGVNVLHERHQEIFSRIKANDDHVSLLVVDPATEQHFRHRDVIIDGQMSQVVRVTCPDVNLAAVAIATDSGINTAKQGAP